MSSHHQRLSPDPPVVRQGRSGAGKGEESPPEQHKESALQIKVYKITKSCWKTASLKEQAASTGRNDRAAHFSWCWEILLPFYAARGCGQARPPSIAESWEINGDIFITVKHWVFGNDLPEFGPDSQMT